MCYELIEILGIIWRTRNKTIKLIIKVLQYNLPCQSNQILLVSTEKEYKRNIRVEMPSLIPGQHVLTGQRVDVNKKPSPKCSKAYFHLYDCIRYQGTRNAVNIAKNVFNLENDISHIYIERGTSLEGRSSVTQHQSA